MPHFQAHWAQLLGCALIKRIVVKGAAVFLLTACLICLSHVSYSQCPLPLYNWASIDFKYCCFLDFPIFTIRLYSDTLTKQKNPVFQPGSHPNNI